MLSQAQVDEFHHTGFLVLRDVFDADEIAELREAAEQVQDEALAGRGEGHRFRAVEDHQQYFRTDGLWRRHAAFRKATVKPSLLAAVGQCLGHPFAPLNDSIVVKQPGSGVPVEWHQDPPYGAGSGERQTFGVPDFDADIYLDDSRLDNGCLFGIAGHHLVGHVDLERFSDEELFERDDAVALELKAGDVLFHAIPAPHGSKANHGTTIRRIFYVHFLAREVLERCHPELVQRKAGFTSAGIEFARSMVAERQASGRREPLAAAGVELTDDGFIVATLPTTPAWHWAALIDELTAEELEAKRTLSATAGAARAD